MELQKNYDVIQGMDTEVIAIAQEEPDPTTLSHTRRFVKNEYPIVADPEKASWEAFSRYGVYVVDKKGVVRSFIPGTKSARPRLDVVFEQLASISGYDAPVSSYAAGKFEVERPKRTHERMARGEDTVTARFMVSHPKIRKGLGFKLAFLPTVVRGYHVYGFGEKQMTPFKVTLELPKGVELAEPIAYPKPKESADELTKSTFKIYEGDIPLSAIELKATDALVLGKAKIGVKVEFQSCDDSACFPPTTKRFDVEIEAIESRRRLPGVAGWNRW